MQKQETTTQMINTNDPNTLPGSTAPSSGGNLGSPTDVYQDTGDLNDIAWVSVNRGDVNSFRADLQSLAENYGKQPEGKKWCTIIVIQDIGADTIRYYTLRHHPVGNVAGQLANLLHLDAQSKAVQNQKIT